MGVTPEELKQAYDNTPVGQAYAVYGAPDASPTFYLWKTDLGQMALAPDFEGARCLTVNVRPEYFVEDAPCVAEVFNTNPIDPALMWE